VVDGRRVERVAIAAVGHADLDLAGRDLCGATLMQPTRLPTPPRAVRW
jgi:hypothetical protein